MMAGRFVTDADIEAKHGYAGKIGAPTDAALMLQVRKTNSPTG